MSESPVTLQDLAKRLAKAEARIDVLTRALHLSAVSVQPTGKWLDAKMAEIDAPDTEETTR